VAAVVPVDPDSGDPDGAILMGTAEAREFHQALPGYRPTRLVQVPQLAAQLGIARVWVKDETERFGLPAFKAMGASWAVAVALAQHLGEELHPGQGLDGLRRLVGDRRLTLATATDGNHGRAVAWMARQLGLGACILVPEGIPAAAAAAIRGEGAEVRVAGNTYDAAVAEAARLASDEVLIVSDTSWEGYTDVPAAVLDGYGTILHEVGDQLRAAGAEWPRVTVVQVGVGSLATAVVRGVRAQARDGLVLSVEPDGSDSLRRSLLAGRPVEVPGPHASVMAGLNCGSVSPLAWPELADGIASAVSVTDTDALRGVDTLREAGIDAGPCAGAGVAGIAAVMGYEAEAGRLGIGIQDEVLLFATEGAAAVTSPRGAGGARLLARARRAFGRARPASS
jgi:diaminopropionate ammonia-lyase